MLLNTAHLNTSFSNWFNTRHEYYSWDCLPPPHPSFGCPATRCRLDPAGQKKRLRTIHTDGMKLFLSAKIKSLGKLGNFFSHLTWVHVCVWFEYKWYIFHLITFPWQTCPFCMEWERLSRNLGFCLPRASVFHKDRKLALEMVVRFEDWEYVTNHKLDRGRLRPKK